MKRFFTFLYLLLMLCSFVQQSDFITEQKRFKRVRDAFQEKQVFLDSLLLSKNLDKSKLEIMIWAFKEQNTLEVWARNKENSNYKFLISYPICARSGILGPKEKQGDGQVPEGFYHINRFNPVSNFHLSLGINYPNEADSRRNPNGNLGGDIFIHGSCVTIGCLPLTDNLIKEVYLLSIHAYANGQAKIPVYIFPFRMTDDQMMTYISQYSDNPSLVNFWKNLKQGYDLLQDNKRPLSIMVNTDGTYVFQ